MKRKLPLFLVLGALLLAGITAALTLCGNNDAYTVGICQFMQHEALDSATQGFKDALTRQLKDRVVFEEKNAQGDYSVCTIAMNDLVSKDVDLILANATSALQIAGTSTTEIPILGTAVTDYRTALQLDRFNGTTARNISGTTDLAPLEQQAAMIKELFPDIKTVGILYCSSEPNSEYQASIMQSGLKALGFACEFYPFSDSNDLSSAALSAVSACEVIYIPTDNTAAANAELIANICMPAKVPVITGEESTCKLCGAATLSIDYYALGYATGEMAVRILEDEEAISSMPIEAPAQVTKKYNPSVCEELGIQIPEDYIPFS